MGHGLPFLGAVELLERVAPPERHGRLVSVLYAASYAGRSVPVVAVAVGASIPGLLPALVTDAVADQGVPLRELATATSDRLALPPAESRKERTFGSFGMFAGIDNRASGTVTQQLTGWRATRPALLEDVRGSGYVQAAAAH